MICTNTSEIIQHNLSTVSIYAFCSLRLCLAEMRAHILLHERLNSIEITRNDVSIGVLQAVCILTDTKEFERVKENGNERERESSWFFFGCQVFTMYIFLWTS